MDDIILAANNSKACATFKTYVNKCFRIKDLKALKFFLGVEVARSSQGLFLCLWNYTLEFFVEIGLLGAKPVEIQMKHSQNLALAEGELTDEAAYQRLVGC